MINGEVSYRLERSLYKPTKRVGKTQTENEYFLTILHITSVLQYGC